MPTCGRSGVCNLAPSDGRDLLVLHRLELDSHQLELDRPSATRSHATWWPTASSGARLLINGGLSRREGVAVFNTFHKSQRFYDAIYRSKDYAGEARKLKQFIAAYKRSEGNSLLDVACGTGGHVPYLLDDFAYEGLDLDPEMLALARERFPEVPFHVGNMLDFSLERRFDVVTCLFSSIASSRTVSGLQQAIATMASHLVPGGVLVISPFFSPEEWILPGHPHAVFVDEPDLKLARINVSGQEGAVAILDFHYLVGTPEGVEHFTEHHELGLFTDEEYRHAFTSAGLEVAHDHDGIIGRGLYIGTPASV
jgi:SAM-dependent methyltransferase